MLLHIPARPRIDFFLRTTRPFHRSEAAVDFLRPTLRECVVDYFKVSVDPAIRREMGRGFAR